ncbi:hypothetical protein GCM10009808_17200 [Microbacterium sediminicola]|uniref:Uncharacterized protein n=2 Tax=Microbacterium sediminicola TaxID=415210 RepID=A0ABP4UAC3_9MICO
MTLIDGISSRAVDTPRTPVDVLERPTDDPATPAERTIVFVHDNASHGVLWQEIMQGLPGDLRVVSIDVRDFENDDLHDALSALEIAAAHLLDWSTDAEVGARHAQSHTVITLISQESGHTPAELDQPSEFRAALLEAIGYLAGAVTSLPATEAIILRSTD